jgi:hypothetical protein
LSGPDGARPVLADVCAEVRGGSYGYQLNDDERIA